MVAHFCFFLDAVCIAAGQFCLPQLSSEHAYSVSVIIVMHPTRETKLHVQNTTRKAVKGKKRHIKCNFVTYALVFTVRHIASICLIVSYAITYVH